MKLYILRAFETMTYRTHTAFYATSIEGSKKLCSDLYDKLLVSVPIYEKVDKDYHISKKEFDDVKIYQYGELVIKKRHFSESIENSSLRDLHYNDYMLGHALGIDSEYITESLKSDIIDNWMSMLETFECNTLIHDSVVDGD